MHSVIHRVWKFITAFLNHTLTTYCSLVRGLCDKSSIDAFFSKQKGHELPLFQVMSIIILEIQSHATQNLHLMSTKFFYCPYYNCPDPYFSDNRTDTFVYLIVTVLPSSRQYHIIFAYLD